MAGDAIIRGKDVTRQPECGHVRNSADVAAHAAHRNLAVIHNDHPPPSTARGRVMTVVTPVAAGDVRR